MVNRIVSSYAPVVRECGCSVWNCVCKMYAIAISASNSVNCKVFECKIGSPEKFNYCPGVFFIRSKRQGSAITIISYCVDRTGASYCCYFQLLLKGSARCHIKNY